MTEKIEDLESDENKNNSDITVIVVDDSDLSRQALSETIRSAGYTVTGEASGALQALEIARTTPCDIFIIDVVMPDVSGIELSKMILDTFRNKSVIMVSSLNVEKVIIDSIASGAVDFIQKPFSPKNLLSSMEKISKTVREEKRKCSSL